jgi:hypothetical protein
MVCLMIEKILIIVEPDGIDASLQNCKQGHAWHGGY